MFALEQPTKGFGFHPGDSYWQNWLGHNEKWFQDSKGNWFVLQTDGQIQPWQKGGLGAAVATVDPHVWDNPDLLFGDSLAPAAQQQLSQLREQYGFHFKGSYWQNFLGKSEKWFQDRAGNWYVLLPGGIIDTATFDKSTKQWVLNSFTSVDTSVYDDPQLLFQAIVALSPTEAAALSSLQQTYGFAFTGNYWQNWLGKNELWFQDRHHDWYVLLTDGRIFKVQNGALATKETATVNRIVWDDPDLLFQA
jgi:hypothetical protein